MVEAVEEVEDCPKNTGSSSKNNLSSSKYNAGSTAPKSAVDVVEAVEEVEV